MKENLFLEQMDAGFKANVKSMDQNRTFALDLIQQLSAVFQVEVEQSRYSNDELTLKLNNHTYFRYSAGSITVDAKRILYEVPLSVSSLASVQSIGPDKPGQPHYMQYGDLRYSVRGTEAACESSKVLTSKIKSLGFELEYHEDTSCGAWLCLKTNLMDLSRETLAARIKFITEVYRANNVKVRLEVMR